MPPASSRAAARASFFEALAGVGLEGPLRARATQHRDEAEALSALGVVVSEGRDELTRLQAITSAARVADSALQRLGRATLDAGLDIAPVQHRRDEATGLRTLEAELRSLQADRGFVARARTKGRRIRLAGKIEALQRREAGADLALGRQLVDEGWLEAARAPSTADAVDAVQAGLPAEASALAALRSRLRDELGLPTLPTALDLRPLLSRTRASEGAAREAAEGAETEAIEAVLARRHSLSPDLQALADALIAARADEHEGQRKALEAQLAAIEEF